MLVSCCEVVERLSRENVKSTLSKNRAESAMLLMHASDIPRSSTVRARMPWARWISYHGAGRRAAVRDYLLRDKKLPHI